VIHSAFKKPLFLLTIVIFALAWVRIPFSKPKEGFTQTAFDAPQAKSPLYESRFVSRETTPQVHAASVVEISGGRLRAFWYGGERERHAGVAIYSSVYEPKRGQWSRETLVLDRTTTRTAVRRHIKALGNPVAFRYAEREIWVFYVSVSVGGWSGSAINLAVSKDDGQTWMPPKRLIASPFLNLSTLVKGPPLLLESGRVALPAYHEFIGVFGEILRLDREGNVVGKTRLSRGTSSLQPVIVPSSTSAAIGFMRYAGRTPKRILAVRTADGGQHWTEPWKTDLPNPNAAVAGARLDDGSLMVVFNASEKDRSNLSLALSSDDGESWRTIHRFEEGPSGSDEYSYPFVIRSSNGDYHLLYTWHRTHIKHVHFNRAWMDGTR
jgi:predicted neuraminidase